MAKNLILMNYNHPPFATKEGGRKKGNSFVFFCRHHHSLLRLFPQWSSGCFSSRCFYSSTILGSLLSSFFLPSLQLCEWYFCMGVAARGLSPSHHVIMAVLRHTRVRSGREGHGPVHEGDLHLHGRWSHNGHRRLPWMLWSSPWISVYAYRRKYTWLADILPLQCWPSKVNRPSVLCGEF